MKKVLIYIAAAIVLLVVGFYALNSYIYIQKQGPGGFQKGYKDTAYVIDGSSVTLINGISQVETAPNSASNLTTKYFGNEAEGDLNSDGVSDIAFVLTQDTGGSGVFYYVVAALKTDTGYVGTNGVFLGDRIAPQTTEIKDGVLTVNYADRKPGEPMVAQPTVGQSKYLQVVNGMLKEKQETGGGNGAVVCTADAKQCPDGSWVGRSGPKCEFVCP